MKIGLKPVEVKLGVEENSKEEFYFIHFDMVVMKKKEVEELFKKMNEENEIIVKID